MVQFTPQLDTHSTALHRRLMRVLGVMVIVFGIGSASSGVLYVRAARSLVGSAVEMAPPVERVDPRPAPAPGPPPCGAQAAVPMERTGGTCPWQ